jgi:tripartite-type tricarboxylate transporter receptor subunit TctC
MRIHPALVTLLAGLLVATLALASERASAQADFPARSITLVVGYPPGGSADATGRVLAEALSRQLKVPVVVENVGGAAGSLAAQKVVNAVPDGYTLLVGSNNEIAINQFVNRAQKYDGYRDLTHLGLVNSQPLMLVATRKAGVKTVDEFLRLVRAQPGKYFFGSSGTGSALHVAGEMIKQKTGIKLDHVPYRGAGPLVADLLGEQLQFAVLVTSSALPHVNSGKLIALGTTEPKRSPLTPQIPALAEHPDLAGLDMSTWYMLSGPRQLPPTVVQKLRTALQAALADPALRKRMTEAGSTPLTGTEDTAAFLAAEARKYKEVVEFAKITE